MMMLDEGVYRWCIASRVNNMVGFCWWTNTRWEHRGLLLYYIQELWHMISMCHWGLFQCIMGIYTRLCYLGARQNSVLLTLTPKGREKVTINQSYTHSFLSTCLTLKSKLKIRIWALPTNWESSAVTSADCFDGGDSDDGFNLQLTYQLFLC